jgi:hypothetical protein
MRDIVDILREREVSWAAIGQALKMQTSALTARVSFDRR